MTDVGRVKVGCGRFRGKKLDGLAGGGRRGKAGMRQEALAGHKSFTQSLHGTTGATATAGIALRERNTEQACNLPQIWVMVLKQQRR